MFSLYPLRIKQTQDRSIGENHTGFLYVHWTMTPRSDKASPRCSAQVEQGGSCELGRRGPGKGCLRTLHPRPPLPALAIRLLASSWCGEGASRSASSSCIQQEGEGQDALLAFQVTLVQKRKKSICQSGILGDVF
jgi:hypothetical protein